MSEISSIEQITSPMINSLERRGQELLAMHNNSSAQMRGALTEMNDSIVRIKGDFVRSKSPERNITSEQILQDLEVVLSRAEATSILSLRDTNQNPQIANDTRRHGMLIRQELDGLSLVCNQLRQEVKQELSADYAALLELAVDQAMDHAEIELEGI